MSEPQVNAVAADQLRSIVERIERLEQERAECDQAVKDVYAEAKGNGFDVAILKDVVKARRQDAHQRAEKGAIFELYMSAVR